MSSFPDRVKGLFGGDSQRPPPPELARPEDVFEYEQEFLKHTPMERDTSTSKETAALDMGDLEKQDRAVDAMHRTRFPWLYDPQKGVRWDFDPILLRNLGQGNTWVGMLIQSITKEVAQTPWQVVKTDDQAETVKRLGTDPFQRDTIEKQERETDAATEEITEFLLNPNPDDNWQDLIEMGLADLLEVGSLTWVKSFPERAYSGDQLVDENAMPVYVQASAPEVWTKSYQSKAGILDGYWQFDKVRTPGGGAQRRSRGVQDPIEFAPEEVVWDDMSPRSNRRYGMPPTLLVKDFLELLDLTVQQEKQYFSKGSIPSGMITFENWDREEVREWKTENEENIKGKPHKMLMLAGQGGSTDFTPFSFNYKDLEFMERMRWYARVISSVFQVPTAVVGIEPEQINYNTFQGERENFESNTLGPYLQKMERVINGQIVQEHWGSGYRFEFQPGMSESTRAMISERVRQEFDRNIRTRNEARKPLGLDEVPPEEDGFKDEVVEGSEEPGEGLDGIQLEASDGEQVEVPDADSVVRELERLEDRMADLASDSVEKQEWAVHEPSYDTAESTDEDWDGVDYEDIQAAMDWTVEYDELQPQQKDLVNGLFIQSDSGFPAENFSDLNYEVAEVVNGEVVLREDGLADARNALSLDTDSPDALKAQVREVIDDLLEREFPDASRDPSSVEKDEPLREGEDWQLFDLQPSDIEALAEDIEGPVSELWNEVLSNEQIQANIERFAADEEDTEKSLTDLGRELRRIFEESDIVDALQERIRDHTLEQAEDAIESSVQEIEDDVDQDAILDRIRNRDMGFVDSYAERMKDTIRDTVAEGWEEGKSTLEIRDDLQAEAEDFEGYEAERIARDQIQRAQGEARNEFAIQTERFGEVWEHSGDRRVRDAHREMGGKWKRPEEDFEVQYENAVVEESFPGDSSEGINCRCTTLLREFDELDESDHAGVS